MIDTNILKFLLVSLIFIIAQHNVTGRPEPYNKLTITFCIHDADCPDLNCVFFFCQKRGCRSDSDCDLWNYKNYYCYNRKIPFFGTECLPKRAPGQVCSADSDCVNGRCNLLFCA